MAIYKNKRKSKPQKRKIRTKKRTYNVEVELADVKVGDKVKIISGGLFSILKTNDICEVVAFTEDDIDSIGYCLRRLSDGALEVLDREDMLEVGLHSALDDVLEGN
jgi:ribosomal protein S17